MMGHADEQRRLFYGIQLEDLVPADHPLRRIRPLIDAERIRALCRPLYCLDNGRPSIPPEQLFLALLGGYLLGVRSDRRLIMELQCNMALRWFVGLDLDSPVWDPSTFSKNREGRFDESGVLAQLFDDTVRLAITRGLVSPHWSMDGTLVRADASHKSFVPLEVYQRPAEYRRTLRGPTQSDPASDDDPGNPTVNFRGQRRTNATHRSTTDPDAPGAQGPGRSGPAQLYREWDHGESASAAAGDRGRTLPRPTLGTGRRAESAAPDRAALEVSPPDPRRR
jgi:transposase